MIICECVPPGTTAHHWVLTVDFAENVSESLQGCDKPRADLALSHPLNAMGEANCSSEEV